jgi:hypothetical protein
MSKQKIDLAVLKRLVAELESITSAAEGIKTDVGGDKVEYVVEMSKASGVCAGVITEAGLLMGDIYTLIGSVSAPAGGAKADFLEKILGGLKGPGNTN